MITDVCVGSFIRVFEPAEDPSGRMKYSICLLFDKSNTKAIEDLQAAIKKAIQKGKETKWGGKVPKFRYEALRDGDEALENGERTTPEYANRMFLNASCLEDSPPGVVGPDAKPLMDQTMLYSGCQVRADIRAYPYKAKGNCGVAWWLDNVMLVADGERLDGKMNAVDAFADYKVDEDEDDGGGDPDTGELT